MSSTSVALADPRPPVLESVAAAAAQPAPKALTTRFLDFWLLGGASLLVWLVMVSLQGFRASWAIDQHFKNLTSLTEYRRMFRMPPKRDALRARAAAVRVSSAAREGSPPLGAGS